MSTRAEPGLGSGPERKRDGGGRDRSSLAGPRRRTAAQRRRREALLGYALITPALAIFGLFVFYPLVHTIQLGFFRAPPFPGLPSKAVGFRQYRQVLGSRDFRDSLKVTVHSFAILRYPFRNALFVVYLTTLMVPFEATIITNRHTIVTLGWVNRFPALVVPFLATGLGTFLLRQAFLGVPRELQDAARLDGYGHWRFMTRVAVPLARPTVAALAVFSFLGAWNQYLWPLLVTDTDRLRTVQIGLRQLEGTSIQQINVTFAGTVLAAFPIFLLLVIFQKQLVRGLTAGAVKG